ncbi:ribosomal protein S5 domain 2-like protein [Viridothelium virens]|uniref:Ribosomal RNA-processing protein 41 n=1 Tax=Viridothelium virens TaxID=1048519 RepID=A0A6A6GXS7_VIRVR|nr:ribosomal protein S5 domain 2-like protein [Viridothelium virens]
MPLDVSTYSLALLRLDGRRWNELRRIYAQISIQAAADGSSYLEMGNTKILCSVTGPEEQRRMATGAQRNGAEVAVEINFAGFSGLERKKRAKGDKRTTEMQYIIASTFANTLSVHLYPHSTIQITLQILAQDGSLLAACCNAATLALLDAGIPMSDYVTACTAGSTASYASNDEVADPLLDLNSQEEQELPFLTVGTSGPGEKVSLCFMETKVQIGRLESMLAVGVDGCKQIRQILDGVVKAHGKRVLEGGMT